MDLIQEDTLYKAFALAWNIIVADADAMNKRWDEMIKTGNPLERLRAKQMKSLAAEGPISMKIPELVTAVLDRVEVRKGGGFEIHFLDGTIKNVCA